MDQPAISLGLGTKKGFKEQKRPSKHAKTGPKTRQNTDTRGTKIPIFTHQLSLPPPTPVKQNESAKYQTDAR